MNLIKKQYKNSKLVLFFFFGVFSFHVTMLKFVWSIESISRVFNVTVLIISFFYSTHVVLSKNFSRAIWGKYLIPGILIFAGMAINILINSISNLKLLTQLGLTIPWILFLLIPYLLKEKKINVVVLWKYAYHIMLIIVALGLIEYYYMFILKKGGGNLLITPNGDFYGGRFSLLFILPDGSPHFRFYALFAEPGSLAMMLLPFIAYSYMYKKYIGMIVLLIGLFYTYSLGGYFGLLMLVFLIYLYKIKKKNIVFSLVSSIIIIMTSYYYLSNSLVQNYESKGNSANVREENLNNAFLNVSKMIFTYPFGMPLEETTADSEQNMLYVGSNFIPINYLQTGGILSFGGYILILILSIKTALKIFMSQKKYKVEYIVVAISMITMLPFLLQRTTIWESPLFAFLYAPIILSIINKK